MIEEEADLAGVRLLTWLHDLRSTDAISSLFAFDLQERRAGGGRLAQVGLRERGILGGKV